MESGDVSLIVPAPAGGGIVGVALSPNARRIVYSVHVGATNVRDLRVINLSEDPSTDVALTNDGVSWDPTF